MPESTSPPAEVYLLEENAARIDVQRLPNGALMISCGLYLTFDEACQLRNGLAAVTSGHFARATSASNYEYDLSRRKIFKALTTSSKPELDQL